MLRPAHLRRRAPPPAAAHRWSVAARRQRDVSLMVLGCAGRKGPKDDPTVLGSTADYSMRGARCSSAIVKPKSAVPPRGTPVSYLACVDGSPGGCVRGSGPGFGRAFL